MVHSAANHTKWELGAGSWGVGGGECRVLSAECRVPSAERRYPARLFGWCLMTNIVHLLLRPEPGHCTNLIAVTQAVVEMLWILRRLEAGTGIAWLMVAVQQRSIPNLTWVDQGGGPMGIGSWELGGGEGTGTGESREQKGD